MLVVVIVLAVLLLAALVGLLVARRRLTSSRAATTIATTDAAARADEAAAANVARDEASGARDAADAARAQAEQARTESELARVEAERRAITAEKEAAAATAEQQRALAEREEAAMAQADAEERLAAFEQRAHAAEAAQQAAVEHAERAERTAPAASGEIDAQVLWALEKARSERTWRYSVAVDPTDSPFSEAGVALAEAIQVELDAAREEVGAEVELDADLPDELSAAGAVLTLRVVQELVADLVRRAETTTLHLAADGSDLVVRVEATGDDGHAVAPAPLPIPPTDALEATPDGIRIRNVAANLR